MQVQGFIKGRPKSLHILDYGLFKVHADRRVIGICGFLIRTDADEAILIDTGFPAKYAKDIARATTEDKLHTFGEVLHCTPDNLPIAQLAKAGLRPADLNLHIVTHTHIDHVGGLHDFPGVPILIAAAERALPRPLYWGEVQPMEWPDETYLSVEGDVDLGPDMRALLVPGHAPGQLALMLDLPETGRVLLTSDAISRSAEIDEKFAGSWDEAQAMAHAERLMKLGEDAFIIYGHCPTQWPDLRKAPDGYT